MINIVLTGIIKFMQSGINAVFTPLTTAIMNLFPSVATPISYVSGFLNYLKRFVPFAFSYLGFTSEVKATLVSLFGLTITLPLATHVFKLAIRWYNALKL